MTQITSIVYKPKGSQDPQDSYVRVPLQTAKLIVDGGIEGDAKGVPNRQLNIMSTETIAGLEADGYKVNPGQLGEQIIVDGLKVEDLPSGTVLQFGDEAQIEVIKLRTGCNRFEHIQQPTTPFSGRLGIIAKVLTPGEIKVGSEVKVIAAQTA